MKKLQQSTFPIGLINYPKAIKKELCTLKGGGSWTFNSNTIADKPLKNKEPFKIRDYGTEKGLKWVKPKSKRWRNIVSPETRKGWLNLSSSPAKLECRNLHNNRENFWRWSLEREFLTFMLAMYYIWRKLVKGYFKKNWLNDTCYTQVQPVLAVTPQKRLQIWKWIFINKFESEHLLIWKSTFTY